MIRPTRVLVVDDQPSMRLLIRTLLERDGIAVVEAADGLEALERLDGVDVVVMDVMMPRLDGIAACKRIRAEHGMLPVILATALADRDARISGKAAGADDFLTKPIDPVELSARVRVLARTKHLADELASERSRLAEQLQQAQGAVVQLERLATLGTLAAGVGHELKNLAQVVVGVGQELAEPAADPVDARTLLASVGRHLTFLGQNLMRLGSGSTGVVEDVDVAAVARHVVELMRRAGRLPGTEVTLTTPSWPVPARAVPLELEQVLINLIGNAVDAVEGRPVRTIGLALAQGPLGCRISVADSGCGMPPEVLERVFEPYFTTKPPGRGTGLGLPVVRQRVEAWGGAVSLASVEGRGTVVTVDLLGSAAAVGDVADGERRSSVGTG